MSLLAPTLEAFFTERLASQRRASPRTVTAYRDAFRLLLGFAQRKTGKAPCTLDLADLDAPLIGAFLEHLERERANSVRTRNARLAAIHSLYRYASLRHPEHAALIARVIAIPPKRYERAAVAFLTGEEIAALLRSPDRTGWIGRRDHALLLLAIQTGLRVSELVGVRVADVVLAAGPHVRCEGKGRKQRCTPLTSETVAVLREWLRERRGEPADPLFPTRRGGPLSPDAVAWLLAKHTAAAAARGCRSLAQKRVTPHVLRYTSAMLLRQAGIDLSVIALWLGHESIESTQIYLHADLAVKERALARTAPMGTSPGRYRAPDTLLAFRRYRAEGLAGLRDRPRSDQGSARVDPALLDEAIRLRLEAPARSAAHIGEIVRARHGVRIAERTLAEQFRRRGLTRGELLRDGRTFGRSASRSSEVWAITSALWKRGLPPSARTIATYRPRVPKAGLAT